MSFENYKCVFQCRLMLGLVCFMYWWWPQRYHKLERDCISPCVHKCSNFFYQLAYTKDTGVLKVFTLALDFPMVHGRGDWPIRTIQIRMTSQRRLSWLASLFTGIWLTWQFSISVIFLFLFTLSFISSYVIIHFLHNKYSLVIFKHAFYYTLK